MARGAEEDDEPGRMRVAEGGLAGRLGSIEAAAAGGAEVAADSADSNASLLYESVEARRLTANTAAAVVTAVDAVAVAASSNSSLE